MERAPVALQNLAIIIRNVDNASFSQETGRTDATNVDNKQIVLEGGFSGDAMHWKFNNLI